MRGGVKHGALFFLQSHLSPPYTHHMIDVGFVTSTVCDDVVLLSFFLYHQQLALCQLASKPLRYLLLSVYYLQLDYV